MTSNKLISLLLVLITISTSSSLATETFLPIDGEYKADVLTEAMDKNIQEIVLKLNATVASNPLWLNEYIAKVSRPGEPLPYHKNFGISNEEYDLMLAAAKHTNLVKISDAVVKLKRSDGTITMNVAGVELPTDTFVFASDESVMRCKLGRSSATKIIDQRNPNSPTGAWRGKQWTITKGNEKLLSSEDFYEVKIAVGKDSKERILVYVKMVGRKSQASLNVSYVLRWPQ